MGERRARLGWVAWLAWLTLAGCTGEVAGGGGSAGDVEAACQSNRTQFNEQVWVPVMSTICIDCHSPGGIAIESGARFELQPAGYPGFLERNFQEVAKVSRIEQDGVSQILLKPLGKMEHGGGAVLKADSDAYRALEKLIGNLREADDCELTPTPPEFADVELASPTATLRKASLQLTGKLPPPELTEHVLEGGEDALAQALLELMDDEVFYVRLKEIYNDLLLTDRYLGYNGYALNILDDEQFPQASLLYDGTDEELLSRANLEVAREPLELIAHVVREDRPFSEILTADYMLVNAASAKVYNIDDPDVEYADGWREEQARALLQGGSVRWPHAGLLTSPMFLNRFPTTPTNRNRHRARVIYELFLATDILEISERPIDPTAAASYINPTRDNPSCTPCHRQIDPVAGAFMKFDDNDQEQLEPDNEWHPEMFPPGYGTETLEVTRFDRAPQWLAGRIVDDPRFSLSVVYTMFRALTGRDPIDYPQDPKAEQYGQRLVAWQAQEWSFQQMGRAFEDSGQNLRVVIQQVLMSPYYRAIGASAELGDEQRALYAELGTARLSSPEQLDRKIESAVGLRWARGWDGNSWLLRDYEILYGGIDSDTVTKRLTAPNGVMAAVQRRMANEVACQAASWDFLQPQAERRLFRHVEPSDTPLSGEAAIRDNIRYLHAQLLGEEVSEAELERTFELFDETWREGSGKVDADELSGRLSWQCQGRVDLSTGEELPEAERLVDDENYAIRAWMAVLSYLLTDFRFLYE